MSLKAQILADIKSAMKNKKAAELQSLKLVYADCKNKEIELKQDINDDQMIAILKKQVKHYEESIESYTKGGNIKHSEEQKYRLKFIKSYLPTPLSEEALKTLVQKTITSLKATSLKDMGLVIKTVQSCAAGSADNRRLVELVKERLQAL